MNTNSSKPSDVAQDATTIPNAVASSDALSSCDSSETSTLNGDQTNKSALRKDSLSKTPSKRVKIVDPGPALDLESDDEDSFSQQGNLERPAAISTGEGVTAATQGQTADQQTAVDRKKTKEERKKEREKKREEEMLKKYQAEQEAKQKVSAKSKCGRWIKHNLKIGEGGYKFVYRGYDTVEARNVAWCEFKREHVDTKEKRQAMFKETEIMLKMNHPHIVRCFDVFREWIDMEDPNNQMEEKGVVIIQELMGEGTLKSVIRKNFLEGQCILKFPLITRWWHQILDALRYMHHKIQPPILHRDLKADNCFLYGASDEEYLNVKVGDFGLATHVNNSGRKTMLGTLGFMAPEIFEEKYDEKVDIYAFGMLMLEVMTNRTPYDECETVIQVAAKTMSGQGPDIMGKILNPSLREVISACIQPLTCFRPTAEELYFHPLFQPKTLPVEVEPNYDNATDRAEVLDRFVRSLDNSETRNPNFNLRLRFRDKKMLQELGLDDGESLEFDLDIYKAEDQDIPDLIHNLRLGYEDKLWRVFENPKQPDKKIVSSHLDKLFSSIRLQMQFLVKMLLGKRWKAILDSLVAEERTKKKQEGASGIDEENDSDTDARDSSSFTIIGKYKTKWSRAKRLLEREIQAYRNRTPVTTGASCVTQVQTIGTSSTHPSTGASVSSCSTQSEVVAHSSTLTSNVASTILSQLPGSHVSPTHTTVTTVPHLPPDASESAPTVHVATVGKFSISTPVSVTVASGVTPVTATVHSASTPPVESTPKPSVTQHVGLRPQALAEPVFTLQPAHQPDPPHHQSMPSVQDVGARPPADLGVNTTLPAVSLKTSPDVPLTSVAPAQSSQLPSVSFLPKLHDESVITVKPEPEVAAIPLASDPLARSTMLLQQLLHDLTAISSKSTITNPPDLPHSSLQRHQQHSILAAAAAAAIAAAVEQANAVSTLGIGQLTQQPDLTSFAANAAQFTPQDLALLYDHLATAGLLGVTQAGQLQRTPPAQSVDTDASNQHTSTQVGESQGPMVIPGHFKPQGTVLPTTERLSSDDGDPGIRRESPQLASLLSQLTEALLNVSTSLGSTLSPSASISTLLGLPTTSPLVQSQPSTQPGQQPVTSSSYQQQTSLPVLSSTSHKPNGTGYPLTHENIERTTEMVVQMLEALRRDPALSRSSNSILGMGSVPGDSNPLASSLFQPTAVDTLLAHRSSQTSLSGSIEATRHPVALPTFATNSNFPPNVPVSVVSENRPLNQDGATFVPPFTGITSPPVLSDSSHSTTQHYTFATPLDSTTISADTIRGEADLSEASRPLSPSDGLAPTYPPIATHCQSVYAVDPTLEPSSSLSGANIPYFSASSCSSTLPTTIASSSCQGSGPTLHNVSMEKQPSLSHGLSYINKLLSSLPLRPPDQLGVAGHGHQSGLEEVAPLLPPLADVSPPSCMPSNDPGIQVESSSPELPSVVRGNIAPLQSLESNALLLSQLSQPFARGQGTRLFPTVPSSSSPVSTAPVNLTCTIPASLEFVIREIIRKLCYSNHGPILLLPTPSFPDSSVTTSPFRVLQIPQEHIFLGVPNSRDPANPYSVTTFTASNGPVFITINDGPLEGSRSLIPRVYQTPVNTAVVLSPDGGVHCVNKPALVVPTHSGETRKTCSPPLSPNLEMTGVARSSQQFDSSVQVRELPIHPNIDTLTLDGVLNLLLALRSVSQQLPCSNNTSPLSDTYPIPNPPTHTESRSVSFNESRHLSTFGSQYPSQNVPHHPTHLPSFFPQMQQSSLDRLVRGTLSNQQSLTHVAMPSIAPIRTISEQLRAPVQFSDAVPVARPSASSNTALEAPCVRESNFANRPPLSVKNTSSTSDANMQPSSLVSVQLLTKLLHDYLLSPHSPSTAVGSQAIFSQQLPNQPTSDASSLNSVASQQLLQLLSAVASPNCTVQSLGSHSQPFRQSSLQHSAPAAQTVPGPSGHGSPVPSALPRPVSFFQPPVVQVSSTGPPIPPSAVTIPAASSSTVTSLISLLGRLLSQNAITAIDSLPDASNSVQTVPLVGTFYPSSVTSTLHGVDANGMTPPIPQISTSQLKGLSQHPFVVEQQAALPVHQSFSGSTVFHQPIPESPHNLCLFQKQDEINYLRDLPPDVQRILSTIYPYLHLLTQPVSGASIPPLVTAPTYSASIPTGSPMVTGVITGPAPTTLTTTVPPFVNALVRPELSTPGSAHLTNSAAPAHAAGSNTHPPTVTESTTLAPTTRVSSTRTTTVASKFTVVPVKCENDQPTPSSTTFVPSGQSETAAPVLQNQVPPLPPRQRSFPNQPVSANIPPSAVTSDVRASADSSVSDGSSPATTSQATHNLAVSSTPSNSTSDGAIIQSRPSPS